MEILEDQLGIVSATSSETTDDVKVDIGFSEDLLMEIFRWLPAKSLFRFKCVSKGCLQLISADSTLQRRKLSSMTGVFYHLNALDCAGHSQSKYYKYARVPELDDNSDDLISTDRGTTNVISLTFLPCYPNFRIIDSCGGLLLCLSGKTKQVSFYVCNPLTRRWTALPKPPNKCSFQNAKLIQESQSPNMFQVIMAAGHTYLRRSSSKLHIYNSDAGEWVEWEVVTEPLQYSLNIQHAVVCEGALYAMAFPSYLARIDIKERSFALIDLPEERDAGGILGACGNHVYFIWQPRHSIQQIWVLMDWRANEWILKYEMGDFGTVALDIGGGSPLCRLPTYDYSYQFQYLPVLHSELELLILRTHCKLFAYHLNSRKVEEIDSIRCDQDVPGHYFRGSSNRFSVFPYTPCLNPVE